MMMMTGEAPCAPTWQRNSASSRRSRRGEYWMSVKTRQLGGMLSALSEFLYVPFDSLRSWLQSVPAVTLRGVVGILIWVN